MKAEVRQSLAYYIHKYSFKHYEVLDPTLYFNRRNVEAASQMAVAEEES